jgi:hypothetical protein
MGTIYVRGGLCRRIFCIAGCFKPFTKQSSRHDYEQGDIVCPFCGSSDVERQVSRFYDAASKRSA